MKNSIIAATFILGLSTSLFSQTDLTKANVPLGAGPSGSTSREVVELEGGAGHCVSIPSGIPVKLGDIVEVELIGTISSEFLSIEEKSKIGGAIDASWVTNTCAIRMSHTLIKAGITLGSNPNVDEFRVSTVKQVAQVQVRGWVK